jgi:prepilin-type N-terminal cleavage/methylation domain-containing protein
MSEQPAGIFLPLPVRRERAGVRVIRDAEHASKSEGTLTLTHSRRTGRGNDGFTLVEAMIVVVVIGLLAALTVPTINALFGMTPAAGARVVVSDLLYAQNLAIATRSTVYVSFGPGSYSIFAAQPFTTAVNNPVTGKPYTVPIGPAAINGPLAGVALYSMTLDDPGNSVLAFDDLGEPMVGATTAPPVPLAATGSIVLKGGTVPVTIWIEPGTGNLTVSE